MVARGYTCDSKGNCSKDRTNTSGETSKVVEKIRLTNK